MKLTILLPLLKSGLLLCMLCQLLACAKSEKEKLEVTQTAALLKDTNKVVPQSSLIIETIEETIAPSVQEREIELTSIFLPVKGQSNYLLELHPLELTVKVYQASNLVEEIQTLGPIQTDIDFANDFYLNNPQQIFNPEDLNFDGYQDIKIPTVSGSGGSWYSVFLFDPKTSRFVESNSLSGLTSLISDSSTKKLHSHEVGSMGGAFYTYTTYSWHGKHLFLERKEIQEGLNEQTPEILIRTVLKVNTEEGMDTAAVVRIWEAAGKQQWCLLKGEWEALRGTPHMSGEAVRTDGRKNGCGD